MTTIRTVPKSSMAIYKAAALISSAGPHQMVELLASVDFGPKGTHKEKLAYGCEIEWLRTGPDGVIDITESTRLHFAAQEPKEKDVGEKAAAPSWNVYERPPLSRRNIPDRRGTRRDIPDWPRRSDDFAFKSVPGGDV